ncbi:ankyrin repeat-containing [Penicillium vulpinum]|uniref:Heterokaryon incompatibility domain-containing protein n=1 Tax=Penicillium vulpinum TaxID=29845 RepID=A0A1V6SDT4_9EURO|nr:ankyrin repeat-containing [Penicillium vulpinum]KAJ5958726.1 ankyrin repeat-containing [Penicillium vulpinum]OQE12096.1 hypothetical protein PENVUL_c001G01560 [Penicillium vulpinum]
MQNDPLIVHHYHAPLKIPPSPDEEAELVRYRYIVRAQNTSLLHYATDPGPKILPFDPSLNLFAPLWLVIRDELPGLCQNMHFCQYEKSSGAPLQYVLDQDPSQVITEHPGYTDLFAWGSGDLKLLQAIQHHCLQARLRRCQSYRCVRIQAEIQQLVPACHEWNNFREWLLCAMSCALAADNVGDVWLLDFTVSGFKKMLQIGLIEAFKQPLAFQVHELIYFWRSEISHLKSSEQDWLWNDPNLLSWTAQSGLYSRITVPAVSLALSVAENLQICPKRLWNLAKISNRGPNDIPALLDVINNSGCRDLFAHSQHNICSPEYCPLENENSNLKEQLHVCDDEETCRILEFPIDAFEEAVLEHANRDTKSPGAVVWSIDETQPMRPFFARQNDYAAISHVWSDGTGVGIREPGKVNSCLFRRFARAAAKLGCVGIWWDTICIPKDRKARRVALSNMNLNYQYARQTIVHDTYLTQFPWKEDGSPGIALVLSPWFTRGWTALELAMSRNIMVLYHQPEGIEGMVLKSLHGDVVAGGITSLGNRIVTRLIERLRDPKPSLFDLLKVLSCRTTSWALDRMIITALMAKTIRVEPGDSAVDMAKKIVLSQECVPKALLCHGSSTMTPRGAFSWCPYNLFDSNLVIKSHFDEGSTMRNFHRQRRLQIKTQGLDETYRQYWENALDFKEVRILADGTALGVWEFYVISVEPLARFKAYSSQVSVEFRVNAALQRPWQYLLLTHSSCRDILILVEPTSVQERDHEWHVNCNYIGCVTGDTASCEPAYLAKFRIGSDEVGVEFAEYVLADLRKKTDGREPRKIQDFE